MSKRNLNFRKRRRVTIGKKLPGLHIKRQTVEAVLRWVIQIAIVCGFACALVLLFGQRVSNAGDSMKPVLKNGDVVLTNRMVYRVTKPKRGDIIAFKPNGNENAHYSIKRVVGLPGETIQIEDGEIYINDAKITAHIYAEDISDAGVADEPMKLGKDEYFVIGDNHAGSDDSRMADIGNIKQEDIFGKVWFVASFGEEFGFVKR